MVKRALTTSQVFCTIFQVILRQVLNIVGSECIVMSSLGGEVDELEEAIRGWLGVDRNVVASPLQERKFRNLKVLVLWLQIADQFGRYCYYGCYCLPEGSHNVANGGYGQPVDNIDRACFDFKQCYRCLINEHEDGEGLPRNPKSDTCKS